MKNTHESKINNIFLKNLTALAKKNPELAQRLQTFIPTELPNLVQENGVYNIIYKEKLIHNPQNPLAEANEIFVMAENNPVLNRIYSEIKGLADNYKYEYEKKTFKARVQLGNRIIARPNFELENFEGFVKNISVVKYIQSKGMDIYKELYCKNIL